MSRSGTIEHIYSSLHIDTPDRLLYRIYHDENYRAAIASLAPLVLKHGQMGDVVAHNILKDAVKKLGEMIYSTYSNLDFKGAKAPLYLTGSIMEKGTIF